MGDEVLLEALSAMRQETTQEANTPPVETTSPEPTPTETENVPPADVTTADATAQSTVAEGTPPPSESPSPPAESGTPEVPKSLADAWALVEERTARVETENKKLREERAALDAYAEKLKAGQVEQAATDFHTQLRKDPLGVLAEAGVPWHNLATMIMTGQASVPEEKPAATPEAPAAVTKEQIAEWVKDALQTHQQTQANEATDLWYQQQIDLLLTKDEYRLLSVLPDSKKKIWDEAVRLSNEKGQILPPETVASIIAEQERARLKKVLAMQEVTSSLGYRVQEAVEEQESKKKAEGGPAEPNQPQTLGANAGAPSSNPEKRDKKPLTEHELLEQALQFVTRE